MVVRSRKVRDGSSFERFMASGYGRLARIGLGLALIGMGLGVVRGTAGLMMALFSIVPIGAGVLGLCPIAPLWGGHFIGSRYCASPARREEP